MRYQSSEVVRVYGFLPEGSDAVTIKVFKDGIEMTVGAGDNQIADNECTEETPGVYVWLTSNFNTNPSGYTTFMYKMIEGYTGHYFLGKFCYPNVASAVTGGGTGSIYRAISAKISGAQKDPDILIIRNKLVGLIKQLEEKGIIQGR